MSQWYGYMDWPLEPGWQCEICERQHPWDTVLVWGLRTGLCRCNSCGARYDMYDWYEGAERTAPKLLIRSGFAPAARLIWAAKETPMEEWSIDDLREFGAPVDAALAEMEVAV